MHQTMQMLQHASKCSKILQNDARLNSRAGDGGRQDDSPGKKYIGARGIFMRGQSRAVGENDALGLSQACVQRLPPWMCQPLVRVSAACTTCIKRCKCYNMLQNAPNCSKMLQNDARLHSREMVVDKMTARGRSI